MELIFAPATTSRPHPQYQYGVPFKIPNWQCDNGRYRNGDFSLALENGATEYRTLRIHDSGLYLVAFEVSHDLGASFAVEGHCASSPKQENTQTVPTSFTTPAMHRSTIGFVSPAQPLYEGGIAALPM